MSKVNKSSLDSENIYNVRLKIFNFSFVGTLLFFCMITLPFEVLYLKIILILSISSYFVLNMEYIKVNKFVLVWFSIYLLWGFIFILLGLYNGNKGVYDLMGIYLIWPILYFIFISRIYKQQILNKLVKVLIYASFFISFSSYAFYISVKTGILNIGLFPIIRQSFDLDNPGNFELFSPFITSLMFLIPFNIALLITNKKSDSLVSKKVLWVLLITNFITANLISRNGLFLVMILSPIIVIILRNIINKDYSPLKISKSVFRLIITVIIIALILMLFFSNQVLLQIDNFMLGFQFTSIEAVSAYARYEQFFNLLEGWQNNIFIGNGLGATLDDFSRNTEKPWMFELSYMSLLFQTGLIGLFSYFGLILLLIIKSIHIARIDPFYSNIVISVLTGMISFLIANATNPYLYAYDHMWMLFSPLAIINVYKYNKNKRIKCKIKL